MLKAIGGKGNVIILEGVKGSLTSTNRVRGFNDALKENPDVKVNPIYSGTYQESIVKALTATKSGKPPQLAVLLSTDMFSLIDEEAIVPIDDVAKSAEDKTPDDQAWLKSFYPAFMENSQTGGKTWGIPFQRSTIVLYWNKDAFKEAGLDPTTGAVTPRLPARPPAGDDMTHDDERIHVPDLRPHLR